MKSSDSKGRKAAPDERVGSVLAERYRIDELLGEGGMGKVYAGEHVGMRKKVAVKIVHKELTNVPEVVARFEREAMAAANIDHPNVAAATDSGKLPDGSVFLVLEFVEGRNLRDEIAAGPLSVERALSIARQIAAALAAAHALGIVHRDLKPENVMLVSRGSEKDFVKVLDFGVAKFAAAESNQASFVPLTKAGMVFGTPEYMAPEQALAHRIDGRTDLYALGVILYEMLSGTRPFLSQGESGILGQQLSKSPPPIAERAPGARVPPRAEAVVTKLLEKEAGNRYQTADEVVQALNELLGPRPGEFAPSVTSTSAPATAILGSVAEVYGAGGAPAAPRPTAPRREGSAMAAGSRPKPSAPTASARVHGAPAVPVPGAAAVPAPPPFPPPPAAPLPPFPPPLAADAVPPPPPLGGAAPVPPPPPSRGAAQALPLPPPPPSSSSAGAPAVQQSSVERVAAKESFSESEPLPAFTYPVLDEAKKQELIRSVEAAQAAKKSSVERVAAKESFSESEPLPAFTYPVLDEAKKQELIKSVEAARVAAGRGPLPPPPTPPASLGKRGLGVRNMLAAIGRATMHVAARASALTKQWIEAACTFIDQNRSRLPARIRTPLSKVRAGVILAVAATLAFALIFWLMLALVGGRSAKKESPPPIASALPAPKVDPVPHEIEEAKSQGLGALEKLAERRPTDQRVLLELAKMHSKNGDHAGAVSIVGKALEADPKANENPLAAEVLAVAVRLRDTTDAAFALLEGRMGAAGAATIYDVSVDTQVRITLHNRAETWVKSDAFKKAASPDVEVAGALRYAKSCSERHALLEHAGEVGEQRALDYLKIAKTGGGCGRSGRDDCFPCLRRDNALKDAIAAIEKRLGK